MALGAVLGGFDGLLLGSIGGIGAGTLAAVLAR